MMIETREPTSRIALLAGQPPAEYIRGLTALCKELADQYQATPEVSLERAWWLLLYRAGAYLRDALEHAYPAWETTPLSYQDAERAYLTLIRLAYFFEPDSVADETFKAHGWDWPQEGGAPDKEYQYAGSQSASHG